MNFRVPCRYGTPIVFRVDKSSNSFYFSTAIEYINRDGDIGSVEIQLNRLELFFNIPSGIIGPYSIKITIIESRRSVIAAKVIPANWAPGQYYHSNLRRKSHHVYYQIGTV
ncbi:hypothetical protein M9H77_27568 [Catharanthus roseus]|uniref:Uncharacterized protein n=1 Tax=Catharanthus roseus TaxID=4058 RepID=A0ACC0AES2_CATRO|nr:hypothetical protein M9H77_27568 [Catharanthus roseus]